MNIYLNPRIVVRNFTLFILFLLAANIAGIYMKLYGGNGYGYGLIPAFNFNTENNIPTLYSTFALIVCAILLWHIAVTHEKDGSSYIPWKVLALLFVFLSVDEIASIHENLTVPVRESLNTSGLFFYAWIIPYGIALTAFIALYVRFLMRLPKKIMFLFIVSGVLFISGAMGFELLGGWQEELYGTNNLRYCIFYTFEESLEMLGVVVFIHTLLSYITGEFDFLTIRIKSQT